MLPFAPKPTASIIASVLGSSQIVGHTDESEEKFYQKGGEGSCPSGQT